MRPCVLRQAPALRCLAAAVAAEHSSAAGPSPAGTATSSIIGLHTTIASSLSEPHFAGSIASAVVDCVIKYVMHLT